MRVTFSKQHPRAPDRSRRARTTARRRRLLNDSLREDPQIPLTRGAHAAPERTLIDVLRATAAAYPEASAIDAGSGALSYRELVAAVDERANELRAAGVQVGDRVGVRVDSGSQDLYIAILAIMRAGAAYVPVDADDTDERARLVFGEARVVGIVGNHGFVPRASDASATDAPAVIEAESEVLTSEAIEAEAAPPSRPDPG